MNQNPFFTVLMPAYNAAPFLRQAVDSVLAQTFTDFEFLIVNDGSTDETRSILESYTDPRIRLHHQENQGVIGALNAGLALARGQYIARFDADDICYPQRLAVQQAYLNAHPECVLLGSAADYIDEDGEFIFEWQPVAFEPAALAEAALHTCPFDHPTVAYPRQLALELGGYPQGAIHFEDHLFWMKFFAVGPTANLPEPLIQHRFNPGSVTIDEKWRGPVYKEIKYRAIRAGKISATDQARLKDLLQAQDVRHIRAASYHALMGKKYLWNNFQPRKARKHLRAAMRITPGKKEPYLLYLLSFLPQKAVALLYQKLKR